MKFTQATPVECYLEHVRCECSTYQGILFGDCYPSTQHSCRCNLECRHDIRAQHLNPKCAKNIRNNKALDAATEISIRKCGPKTMETRVRFNQSRPIHWSHFIRQSGAKSSKWGHKFASDLDNWIRIMLVHDAILSDKLWTFLCVGVYWRVNGWRGNGKGEGVSR